MNAREARLLTDTVKLRQDIDEQIRKTAADGRNMVMVEEKCNNTQFVMDELIKRGFTVRKDESYWCNNSFYITW